MIARMRWGLPTKEHLAPTDVGIIRMRRRMLDAVRGFMQGATPLGLGADSRWTEWLKSSQ